MNINIPNISFGGGFVYKDRYIPNKQDITHDVIRTDLEEKLGSYFSILSNWLKKNICRH
ncbi:MAG: hypothetical protein ACI37R_01135 [Candidatus Avigastranaerophilus sp.]